MSIIGPFGYIFNNSFGSGLSVAEKIAELEQADQESSIENPLESQVVNDSFESEKRHNDKTNSDSFENDANKDPDPDLQKGKKKQKKQKKQKK